MTGRLVIQASMVLAEGGQPALDKWVATLTPEQQEELLIETYEDALELDRRVNKAKAVLAAPRTDD